ncbi:hypothetical protein IV203_016633 [Nitzschia inconspicua]|uniref:Uncharacterized protein n=1 Tax=Nitzschia inconspicua TaxID=303405 RepID=A0A9K3KRS2_9STRA|nr:hypothetical protein IV203_016633 [Nitzschia inconspicua]
MREGTSPTVALVMDSNRFPHPYLITTANVSAHPVSSSPIVVQLRGEMGNHLSTIAHGIGLQLAALQDYNLSTHLLLRHQTLVDNDGTVMENPKWLPTSRVLRQCFPAMRHWDFSAGSRWGEFDQLWKRQRDLQEESLAGMDSEQMRLLQRIQLVNGRIMAGRKGLDDMKEPVTEQDISKGLAAFAELRRSGREGKGFSQTSSFLNSPFLYSDSMDNMILVKRFLKIFRDLFRIDPSCCASERPDADEAVFHYRNFAKEFELLSRRKDGVKRSTLPSFEEATPHQTAQVLFSHLKPGHKVAITSRFADDPVVFEYVHALEKQNFQVRVIDGGSNSERQDFEDFCFLLHARKIVGNFRSTFVFWAALLGKAERILLYTIKSPGLKVRFGPFIKTFFTGNFKWNFDDDGAEFQKHLQMILLPMEVIQD